MSAESSGAFGDRRLQTQTRQSNTAYCAPGAATRGVTLSTRHFLVAIYAGTLCANTLMPLPSSHPVPAPQIRSHDFWHYINLYVCMYVCNIHHAHCSLVGPDCKN